jgi:hypothetical protein
VGAGNLSQFVNDHAIEDVAFRIDGELVEQYWLTSQKKHENVGGQPAPLMISRNRACLASDRSEIPNSDGHS